MHLGILVTCFVPLLHNRLSRQLGQLSTPPPTSRSLLPFSSVISCSIPFYFFLSLPLSLSPSIFVLLFVEHSLSFLPLASFIPTPSLYFFLSFLTTSALSVACPFSSSLFPCVTYSSSVLGVIGRNSRTSNYRNKTSIVALHVRTYRMPYIFRLFIFD